MAYSIKKINKINKIQKYKIIYSFHCYFSFTFFLTVCRLQEWQCVYRSFRLVHFTYLRCCFQFVLSLSRLRPQHFRAVFCFERLRSGPTHPPFSQVSTGVFSFYLLLILLLFHLFSPRRQRCLRRPREVLKMSQTRLLGKRIHCLLGQPTKCLSRNHIHSRILIQPLQTQ